jgi:hypothetical protein
MPEATVNQTLAILAFAGTWNTMHPSTDLPTVTFSVAGNERHPVTCSSDD